MAGLIDSLKKQRFNEGDSMIASAAMHPTEAATRLKDWLENQINTGIGQPQLDESTGFYRDPTDEQQHEAAFNLAGLMETGSIPFAPKSAGGTLGTFIGPKAANWDAKAAAEAAKMLDEGMNPTEVWRMKLMGRMPDNSMFSEIPDNTAIFNMENIKRGSYGERTGKMADIMDHPELQSNYPQLNDIGIEQRPNTATGGAYDFIGNNIDIGGDANEKSVLLHEIQHAIQQREGWARGGTPSSAWYDSKSRPITVDLYNKKLSELKKVMPIDEYAKKAWGSDKVTGEISTDYEKNYLPSAGVISHNIDRDAQEWAGREYYKRLTGEAQARATQERLAMDMLQRRSNYPLEGGKLGGIPLDQLINRYGGEGPQQGGLLSFLKQKK